MKIKWLGTVTTAVLLAAGTANAAHIWEDPGGWWDGHWYVVHEENTPKFTANELSLDLFGSYTAGERRIEDLFETDIRHGRWGGGVGLNYFFIRELGIGGDINITDNDGPFVDQALGSLIFRLPIESVGLAPYVFGGGGRLFDPRWEWAGHGGVGLEWRPNPITGIFVDGRYIWPDHTSDRILFRAGLRLAF